MAETFTPAPHQPRLHQCIVELPHVAIWADMGSGKTATSLWAVSDLIEALDVSRVLVVAPKRVALNVWTNEIKRWSQFGHLTCRVLTSDDFGYQREEVVVRKRGKETRVKRLVPKASPRSFLTGEQIHTISRDHFTALVTLLGKKHWGYDMVIIDEASGFRDQDTSRWKAAKTLRKHGCLPRLVELTGTPRPKSLIDLWAQVYLLDQGQRLGRTLTAYRDRWFVPDKRSGERIFSWKPKAGAESEIFAAVSDICFSLLPEDLIQLPERSYHRIMVPMPPAARRSYDQMERDRLVSVSGFDVVAAQRATLVGKLLQLCGGAAYDEHGNPQHLHDAKLDALEELVDGTGGAPLLVAYWYQHERDRIKARFPGAVEINDAPDTEERWNRGEIQMLLLHPQAGSHGLNLQFNDGHGVWFGPIHDLELYLQWNKRLHRPGRKTPVRIYHLLAEDTIDRAVLEAMDPKYEGQDRLLRAVRLRMEGT